LKTRAVFVWPFVNRVPGTLVGPHGPKSGGLDGPTSHTWFAIRADVGQIHQGGCRAGVWGGNGSKAKTANGLRQGTSRAPTLVGPADWAGAERRGLLVAGARNKTAGEGPDPGPGGRKSHAPDSLRSRQTVSGFLGPLPFLGLPRPSGHQPMAGSTAYGRPDKKRSGPEKTGGVAGGAIVGFWTTFVVDRRRAGPPAVADRRVFGGRHRDEGGKIVVEFDVPQRLAGGIGTRGRSRLGVRPQPG